MTETSAELVVIIGAGTMGAGIAHAWLAAGVHVAIVEQGAAAQSVAARISDSLHSAHSRGTLQAGLPEQLLTLLAVGTELPAAEAGVQVVIEAVPEDAELKAAVLAPAAARFPQALIATNTSSLSVTELAAHILRPERFLGMHFFNPVPRSALVELVPHATTSEPTLALARSWVQRLGLEHITVADRPGFATSRLGVCVGLEAIRMLEEGVASAEDIDTAMRLAYRWPMGPLRLTDVVGLDVRLAIAEGLSRTLGARYAPPRLLVEMVEQGLLGRKTGRGFYTWS